jgi:hypothetical protein
MGPPGRASIGTVELAIAVAGLVLSAISTAFTGMAYFQSRTSQRLERPAGTKEHVAEPAVSIHDWEAGLRIPDWESRARIGDDETVAEAAYAPLNPLIRLVGLTLLVLSRWQLRLAITLVLVLGTTIYVWWAWPVF